MVVDYVSTLADPAEEAIQEERKRQEEFTKKLERQLNYSESLWHAVKSDSGKLILKEIKAQHTDLIESLEGVCLQTLSYPYYEYNKDDLQRMKAIRAKIQQVEHLLGVLDEKNLGAFVLNTRKDLAQNKTQPMISEEAIY